MPKHDELLSNDDDSTPIVELAADTLRGDCRDSMLAWFKAQPKSWAFMNEGERHALADAVDRYSFELVRQACNIIASEERPTIVGVLKEYREKDGIEAKLKFPSTSDVVTNLHEACGQDVLVVTSGFDLFKGEAGPADIPSDQRDLGLGAEYNEQ